MPIQLLNLTEGDLAEQLDELLPDRAAFGSRKAACLVTLDEVQKLLQAMYMRDVIGPWHASLAQFLEGYYKLQ